MPHLSLFLIADLQEEVPRVRKQKHGVEEEPIDILKTRLAKGQKITKEEYHELRKSN